MKELWRCGIYILEYCEPSRNDEITQFAATLLKIEDIYHVKWREPEEQTLWSYLFILDRITGRRNAML